MPNENKETRMKKFLALAACGALGLGVAACGSDSKSSDSGSQTPGGGGAINGAGATFPQPVYDEWAARFKDKSGTTMNYQAVGTGACVAQFTATAVEIAASDSAMSDAVDKGPLK